LKKTGQTIQAENIMREKPGKEYGRRWQEALLAFRVGHVLKLLASDGSRVMKVIQVQTGGHNGGEGSVGK